MKPNRPTPVVPTDDKYADLRFHRPQPTVGEQTDEEFVRSNYAITSSTAGEYGKYRRWSVTVTISDTQFNGNGSTKSGAWADLRRHLPTPITVGEQRMTACKHCHAVITEEPDGAWTSKGYIYRCHRDGGNYELHEPTEGSLTAGEHLPTCVREDSHTSSDDCTDVWISKTDPVGEQRVSDPELKQMADPNEMFSSKVRAMARELVALRSQRAAVASDWKALSVTAIAAENPSVAEHIAELEKRNGLLVAPAAEEKQWSEYQAYCAGFELSKLKRPLFTYSGYIRWSKDRVAAPAAAVEEENDPAPPNPKYPLERDGETK